MKNFEQVPQTEFNGRVGKLLRFKKIFWTGLGNLLKRENKTA